MSDKGVTDGPQVDQGEEEPECKPYTPVNVIEREPRYVPKKTIEELEAMSERERVAYADARRRYLDNSNSAKEKEITKLAHALRDALAREASLKKEMFYRQSWEKNAPKQDLPAETAELKSLVGTTPKSNDGFWVRANTLINVVNLSVLLMILYHVAG